MSDHNLILGWHFLREDGRLRYGDGRKPEDGEWLSVDGEIEGCWWREDPLTGRRKMSTNPNGFHASPEIHHAVFFAPGPILCRVMLSGDIDQGDRKIVARKRKILWRMDASKPMHQFALEMAEHQLRHFPETGGPVREAMDRKRKWLQEGMSWEGDPHECYIYGSALAMLSYDPVEAAQHGVYHAGTQVHLLERRILEHRPYGLIISNKG